MWRAVLYIHHVTQLLFLLLDLKNELSVAYQVGLSLLSKASVQSYMLAPAMALINKIIMKPTNLLKLKQKT